MARGALGVQNVPQPQQVSDGRVESIARFQGVGNVEGVADRRDDEGSGADSFNRFDPELQQTTDPGVLQHEQPTAAEFFMEHGAGTFAKLFSDGRSIPTGIECPPIVPSGPGRC